jgi:hypothetical protein
MYFMGRTYGKLLCSFYAGSVGKFKNTGSGILHGGSPAALADCASAGRVYG